MASNWPMVRLPSSFASEAVSEYRGIVVSVAAAETNLVQAISAAAAAKQRISRGVDLPTHCHRLHSRHGRVFRL